MTTPSIVDGLMSLLNKMPSYTFPIVWIMSEATRNELWAYTAKHYTVYRHESTGKRDYFNDFPIYTYEELGSRPSYPMAAPLKEMQRIYPDIFNKEKKMTTPNAGLYKESGGTYICHCQPDDVYEVPRYTIATLSEIKEAHPTCSTCDRYDKFYSTCDRLSIEHGGLIGVEPTDYCNHYEPKDAL